MIVHARKWYDYVLVNPQSHWRANIPGALRSCDTTHQISQPCFGLTVPRLCNSRHVESASLLLAIFAAIASHESLLLQIVVHFLGHDVALRILHLLDVLVSGFHFIFIPLELLVEIEGFFDTRDFAEKRGVFDAESTQTVGMPGFILKRDQKDGRR